MNIWRGYGLSIETQDIDDGAGGPEFLGGMESYGITADFEVNRDYVDGSPMPRFASTRGVEESISMTTLNVQQAIDLFGSTGQCMRGNSTDHDGVDFYLAQFDECNAGAMPGSVHKRYSVDFTQPSGAENRGLIVPQNMTCDHRGDLMYSLNILPRSVDGSSSSLVAVDAVPLPAGLSDSLRRWTLSPNTIIAGIPLTAFKSVEMNFDLQILRESVDSNIYDSYIGIERIGATIDVRGIDPGWIGAAAITEKGVHFTHANTQFFFRRRADVGASDVDFYPDTDAVHIKATADGLCVPQQFAGGNSTAASETGLRLFCTYDNTNEPIVLLTEQQIT